MNRCSAFAAHFGLSVAVAGLVFLPIYFFWYPDALFQDAGGLELFLLVAGIDVTLGPLITLIIFKPGKKGLAFDLSVIATLQVAALAYGVSVLFESRPAYIVFVKDRFELVRANQIPDEELERARGRPYARAPWTGPAVVGARLPTDPREAFRVAVSSIGGIDVQHMPLYYVPYDDVRGDARSRAQPLGALHPYNPGRRGEIARLPTRLSRPEQDLAFLPMRAGKRDLTVVVDRGRAEVLHIADFKPWQYQ